MPAMTLAVDHLFLLIEPDGPEIEALRHLGLTETYRRTHPGQGTANACFAFDNLYLELLWLTREAEARSANQSRGFQRRPALGEKALPKSLYSSARPAISFRTAVS